MKFTHPKSEPDTARELLPGLDPAGDEAKTRLRQIELSREREAVIRSSMTAARGNGKAVPEERRKPRLLVIRADSSGRRMTVTDEDLMRLAASQMMRTGHTAITPEFIERLPEADDTSVVETLSPDEMRRAEREAVLSDVTAPHRKPKRRASNVSRASNGTSRTSNGTSRTSASPEKERFRRSAYQGTKQISRGDVAHRKRARSIPKPPEMRPIWANGKLDTEALVAHVKAYVRGVFTRMSLSKEELVRGGIVALMMTVFALIQTTVFTRLPPFGAVPDLMLSFVIAVAVTEGEKWGTVTALFSSLVITSVGATGADPAPLLYFVCACTAGLLSHYVLKKNAVIRMLYQLGAGLLRAVATLIMLALTVRGFSLGEVTVGTVIPEFFSTLILAPFVHLTVWLALLAFHRSREQRTDDAS